MDLMSRIKQALAEKGIKHVTPETPFRDMGLDSLDAMGLIMRLEKELNVRIDDDKLMQIKNINDLLAVLADKK